jgi:hypothetical protein
MIVTRFAAHRQHDRDQIPQRPVQVVLTDLHGAPIGADVVNGCAGTGR